MTTKSNKKAQQQKYRTCIGEWQAKNKTFRKINHGFILITRLGIIHFCCCIRMLLSAFSVQPFPNTLHPMIHPDKYLFILLPSGRQFTTIKTKSAHFLNSTYYMMVYVLNSSGIAASVFHTLYRVYGKNEFMYVC